MSCSHRCSIRPQEVYIKAKAGGNTGLGADHPILWEADEDESYYLKFYIFQVCDEM